ncbi:WD-40 repeat protein [Reticulomyxa filosa]|uniref:WD-40 repeat protein n=1 Tax=Reticulomyxa filosa TaxID=46433 RepID=X6PA48_RETFI|nr:WD-40 repeat protein [Reticulomyxa filosa]|eukprot:ETO35008.1 WD-40 repeat protein [Reticulomyxa filosa]
MLTFIGHTWRVNSIDYSIFDGNPLLCSGSHDKTVRVWDVETGKQIQIFNEHSGFVICAKFSPYHYHKHRRIVVCSSSYDRTIRFWDFQKNQQLQLLTCDRKEMCGIELSSFNGGRYLCCGAYDSTVNLWDIEASKSLHTFRGHSWVVWCVDFSPLQSNNNYYYKSNGISMIGGSGYTICSGSWDKTIRIWDIETTKQFIIFNGHNDNLCSVKYASNESGISGGANIILSGSSDKSARLWDIRSGQQIQAFNGHTSRVTCVEYPPFVVNNIEIGGSSNVICSGSSDHTIRFWDIRSNKKELYTIEEENPVYCLKFLRLENKGTNSEKTNSNCNVNLCYGLNDGHIRL